MHPTVIVVQDLILIGAIEKAYSLQPVITIYWPSWAHQQVLMPGNLASDLQLCFLYFEVRRAYTNLPSGPCPEK